MNQIRHEKKKNEFRQSKKNQLKIKYKIKMKVNM